MIYCRLILYTLCDSSLFCSTFADAYLKQDVEVQSVEIQERCTEGSQERGNYNISVAYKMHLCIGLVVLLDGHFSFMVRNLIILPIMSMSNSLYDQLGHVYSDFSYNWRPATTSSFLCIKITMSTSSVTTPSHSEQFSLHLFTRCKRDPVYLTVKRKALLCLLMKVISEYSCQI